MEEAGSGPGQWGQFCAEMQMRLTPGKESSSRNQTRIRLRTRGSIEAK